MRGKFRTSGVLNPVSKGCGHSLADLNPVSKGCGHNLAEVTGAGW